MPARGYVFYGSVPWAYLWLTEQNLAHALADRHKVLYVDPPMSPLTPFRYRGRTSTPTRLRDVRVRREGPVTVVRPLSLPPVENARARRVSATFVRSQIRRAAAQLGLQRPVVVSARWGPGLEGALETPLRVQLIMDWFEAGADLLGRPRDEIAAETDAACATADMICATSRRIVRGLAERGHRAELLRHGFHADMTAAYDASEPPEYARLQRPIMGYTGTIDARLDFETLAALAERTPGTIVLIGRVSPRLDPAALDALAERANVKLLGPRDRAELPPYIAHLDCALLPYLEDEWGRYGSPLKMWDYLYAGPPIVGSGYLELQDYPPPLVRYARGTDEFVAAVAEAVDSGADTREARRSYALQNTWDDRARELEALVAEKFPS